MSVGKDDKGVCPNHFLHCSLEQKRRCPRSNKCYIMTRRFLFGPNITPYPEEEEMLKRKREPALLTTPFFVLEDKSKERDKK